MGLNCGASCAKYVLFAFNIIFFLGGAGVLGVGIWVRVDSGSFMDFMGKVDPSGAAVDISGNILGSNLSWIYTIAYMLIGIGSFVFVVGFMGCCGAIKEWRPLLVGYAICLIIIMCFEIGIGIAVGVYKDQVIGELNTVMQRDLVSNYRYVPTTVNANDEVKPQPQPQPSDMTSVQRAATNSLNSLFLIFGCCGVNENYGDLLNSPYGTSDSQRKAPVFCCKMRDPFTLTLMDRTCQENPTGSNSNMNSGCIKKIEQFIKDYAPAVIGVAVGIGLVELVGAIFAFCLCCAINDKRKYN